MLCPYGSLLSARIPLVLCPRGSLLSARIPLVLALCGSLLSVRVPLVLCPCGTLVMIPTETEWVPNAQQKRWSPLCSSCEALLYLLGPSTCGRAQSSGTLSAACWGFQLTEVRLLPLGQFPPSTAHRSEPAFEDNRWRRLRTIDGVGL